MCIYTVTNGRARVKRSRTESRYSHGHSSLLLSVTIHYIYETYIAVAVSRIHKTMKGLVIRMNQERNSSEPTFSEGMCRREFLALCALGTLPGVLAACQDGPTVAASTTPNMAVTSSPTKQPSLTESDLSALARSLKGPLVRPNSSRYATARQLFDPRYDVVQPTGIAYCASPEDVQTCLAFVRKFNLPFAPRSGGHSFNGYSTSTGLVLDVTAMNTVMVNTSASTATIGAGTRLIDVYSSVSRIMLYAIGDSKLTKHLAIFAIISYTSL